MYFEYTIRYQVLRCIQKKMSKNMILSEEELRQLKYLKRELRREIKSYVEELYFEKDRVIKKDKKYYNVFKKNRTLKETKGFEQEEKLKEIEIPEGYRKLADLIGKKVGLYFDGLEEAVLTEIIFDSEVATTKEEFMNLFQEKKRLTALKFTYVDYKNEIQTKVINNLSIIDLLGEIILKPLSVEEINLCKKCISLMGKRLKDNQYEIITIEGITFEDGKTYKNENEINNALSKNLKPKMIFTFCQKTKDSEKIKISFPMSYIDFIVKKSDKEIESKLNEE